MTRQRDDKQINYHGVLMDPDWPARIEQEQSVTTLIMKGMVHKRIRYGNENADWGADYQPCHDCLVIKGQFHVGGCDAERCPCCDGQMISCKCLIKEADD